MRLIAASVGQAVLDRSIRLDTQLPQSRGQAIGAFAFGFGSPAFGVGALAFGFGAWRSISARWRSASRCATISTYVANGLPSGPKILRLSGPSPGSKRILRRGLSKSDIDGICSKVCADSQPTNQITAVRVVEVILLNTVTLVELKLAFPSLAGAISGRKDLEDDLGCDSVFLPLHVRAAVSFGAPEDDHRIGSHANFWFSLDGIPQEIAGDEHVGIVAVDRVEATLDRDDPAELQRVIRHGLAIAVGIDDRG